jgi:hypothetical protein
LPLMRWAAGRINFDFPWCGNDISLLLLLALAAADS